MGRMTILKHVLPVVLFAFSLGLPLSSARADVSSTHQNEAASAFQALDALARDARAQGDLPRLSNPTHARVLDRLWNVEATLGAPPYQAADVPALLTIGDRAGAVFKTYVLFAPQNGTVPDTAANTFKYQDEIARAGAYLLNVYTAELEAATDFVSKLPADQMNEARRTGLRQMQLGITEQVTGLMLMLRSPSLRPENRLLLLDALNGSAIPLAAAISPADRKAVTAQIDAALPGLSQPEHDRAQILKSAFTPQECNGLCALGD
ncbi:hypothetical protein D3C80_110960 [compost metagenome]